MSEKLYVLGYPVDHSKSPAMYNAVYDALGLDWQYGFMSCENEEDARAFLDAGDFLSINITTPYKPLALSYAATATPAAALAHGANVLVATPRGFAADNTDGVGAVAALERAGAAIEGARVAVCGTGPAARAILSACAFAGAFSVALLGRDEARTAGALAAYTSDLAALAAQDADFNPFGSELVRRSPAEVLDGAGFVAAAYGSVAANEALTSADVVVDATTLGMRAGDPAPFDTALLHAGQTAFDVVYAHGETAFLAGARAAGCRALDGEGMLVAQAIATLGDIAAVRPELDCAGIDLFALMAKAAGFSL